MVSSGYQRVLSLAVLWARARGGKRRKAGSAWVQVQDAGVKASGSPRISKSNTV